MAHSDVKDNEHQVTKETATVCFCGKVVSQLKKIEACVYQPVLN
jgi:hypothetical protein